MKLTIEFFSNKARFSILNQADRVVSVKDYELFYIKDKNNLEVAGDSETSDMKQLFEICYFAHPNTPIKRNEIIRLINGEEELFSYLDFGERKGQINFGLKLRKFIGRIFSDIKLEILDRNVEPMASGIDIDTDNFDSLRYNLRVVDHRFPHRNQFRTIL